MSQQESVEARQLLEHYCREGSQSSFKHFYRQHAGRLWRFLRFRGVSEEAAYDLVSEAFLRFIQVICKDLRSPVALLYRIAVNLKIDAWRRSRTAPFDESVDTETLADTAAVADERYQYVRELVSRLPESEQNLLLMRYWLGLTHKEIAEVTGQPAGSVRRRTTELLEELKAMWAAEQ